MEKTIAEQTEHWKNLYNVQWHLEVQKICDNLHKRLIEMVKNGEFKLDK